MGHPLSSNLSRCVCHYDSLLSSNPLHSFTGTPSEFKPFTLFYLDTLLSSNPLHSSTGTPSYLKPLTLCMLLRQPLELNPLRSPTGTTSEFNPFTLHSPYRDYLSSSTLSRCIVLTGTTSEFRSHWDHLRVQRFYAAWYPTETSSEFRPFTLSY